MNLDTFFPKKRYSLEKYMDRLSFTSGKQFQESHDAFFFDIKSYKKKVSSYLKQAVNKEKICPIEEHGYFLIEFLEKIFPLVVKLIGSKKFKPLACEYVKKHAPRYFSYQDVGKNFPKWLRKNTPPKEQKMLYEASLIDEAFDRASYAGDYKKIAKMKRGQRLYLQPQISLIHTSIHLLELRKNLSSKKSIQKEKILFDGVKEYFLLYNDQKEIVFENLEQIQYNLLQAFEKGAFLQQALGKVQTTSKSLHSYEDQMKVWFYQWIKKRFFIFWLDQLLALLDLLHSKAYVPKVF